MTIDATSGSTYSTALKGLQREFKSIADNASKIANFGLSDNPEGNLAEPIIDMKQDVQQIKAIFSVIKTQDELDESVLDVLA